MFDIRLNEKQRALLAYACDKCREDDPEIDLMADMLSKDMIDPDAINDFTL